MLSAQTVQIVKSTAPILQEHGETLTRHFYTRMFNQNPEVAPFFNPAHQESGKQQKALAGAIAAYAAHIDNLTVLTSAVELIAQKHASLMIKAEHYPIVGKNLLASIQEVLGEGATEDIIRAWSEAYEFLAGILIAREKQIYQENIKKAGGWEGFKLFRVVRKEKESRIISSFYLEAEDKAVLPNYKPGQYITVGLQTKNGQSTMRNYSLSHKPSQDFFRISVKREISDDANIPVGYVSNILHDSINVGDTIKVGPPCGDFFLDVSIDSIRPIVLLGAGIGITPIMSILLEALDLFPNRKIIFIHAVLNKDVQAFKKDLDTLAQKYVNLKVYYRYSEDCIKEDINNISHGFVTKQYLEHILDCRDCDYYFCGPQPFMVSIFNILKIWNTPSKQIFFEFFGPRQELV